jgi:hypothetical protein
MKNYALVVMSLKAKNRPPMNSSVNPKGVLREGSEKNGMKNVPSLTEGH